MKQHEPDAVVAIFGVLALAAGFGESKRALQGIARVLPHVCIGAGSGFEKPQDECNAAIAKR